MRGPHIFGTDCTVKNVQSLLSHTFQSVGSHYTVYSTAAKKQSKNWYEIPTKGSRNASIPLLIWNSQGTKRSEIWDLFMCHLLHCSFCFGVKFADCRYIKRRILATTEMICKIVCNLNWTRIPSPVFILNVAEFSCIEMCLMTNQLQGKPSARTKFDVISRHQKVQSFHGIAYINPTVQRDCVLFWPYSDGWQVLESSDNPQCTSVWYVPSPVQQFLRNYTLFSVHW